MSGHDDDDPPKPRNTLTGMAVPTPPSHVSPATPQSGPVPAAPVQPASTEGSNPVQQLIDEVPGKFVSFLKVSARRAFRLRIEAAEVLPEERWALEHANPPIVEPNLQAFLAWRRSVLFLVVTLLFPLTVVGIIDAVSGTKVAAPVRFVKVAPVVAEGLFFLICWGQLRNWYNWREQRRMLFIGWLLFMMTPFIVFIYPLKTAFIDIGRSMSKQQIAELGWRGVYNKAVAPFVFSMLAMLQLAPKTISLMPGLIRASMVIKLLFPGAAAPGWLIAMSAPLYAMIAYAILVIPYQFTGEPLLIAGVLLIVAAQAVLARAGFQLARPLTEAECLTHIKKVRAYYVTVMVLSAGCIVAALGIIVDSFKMQWTTVITTVLKFEANVLILTMIGADLVVTNLDRARGYTAGREHVEQETDAKIASFVGLNAPREPAPRPPR